MNKVAKTNDFLGGAGFTAGGSLFGVYVGVNHSYGGATAIEIGLGISGVTKVANPNVSGGTGVSYPIGKMPGIGKYQE